MAASNASPVLTPRLQDESGAASFARPGTFAPATALRVALGLLLLTAAALKAHALATGPVPASGLLGSRAFQVAAVEIEVALGLWLVLCVWPRAAWAAALVGFAGFAGIALHRALSGESSCGCFGRIEVNPWHMVLLDTCAVFGLLRWRPEPLPPANTGPDTRAALNCGGIIVCVGILAALWIGSYVPTTLGAEGEIVGDAELVVLEPNEWLDRRLPLLPHIDVAGQLASGKWQVLLYHHDCAKCRTVIAAYEIMAAKGKGKFALIAVPPHHDSGPGDLVVGQANFLWGRLSDRYRWFVQTPTEIRLDQGVVVHVK